MQGKEQKYKLAGRSPIKSNYTMELMDAGDYVKFFIPAIYDGVPTGAILKIIKKRIATGI